ncbi:SpoVT-AbrB domain-containing protein [Candidatus Electrothrix aarhusensis]
MNIKVVRIGNSRGIRLPRKILDQCHIEDQLDLNVKGGKIVVTPVRKTPRDGWEEYAIKMHEAHDDELMIPDVFPDEDHLKW